MHLNVKTYHNPLHFNATISRYNNIYSATTLSRKHFFYANTSYTQGPYEKGISNSATNTDERNGFVLNNARYFILE